MPLVMIDSLPSGQTVVNTDDIVVIETRNGTVSIKLRGVDQFVQVPHNSVADLAAAMDEVEARILREHR